MTQRQSQRAEIARRIPEHCGKMGSGELAERLAQHSVRPAPFLVHSLIVQVSRRGRPNAERIDFRPIEAQRSDFPADEGMRRERIMAR
jgi:hypothetical protein